MRPPTPIRRWGEARCPTHFPIGCDLFGSEIVLPEMHPSLRSKAKCNVHIMISDVAECDLIGKR